MSLFVLAETPAGYGLFKSSDKKLLKREDLSDTAEGIAELLTLKKFVKFDSAVNALEETAAIKEGKVPSMLAKLLDDVKAERKASLAVADKALGSAISKLLIDFNVTTVSDSSTMEVFRSIRGHLAELIPGLSPENVDRMALGLSHSMSRHKLRFSADKVDAMVIQAVKLLDDMDKELNVYAMRAKEWYGWHFPELAKILNDNLAYCRLVVAVGMRSNFAEADLTDYLPEELVDTVKAAAEISMGTEITEEDLENIKLLAEQVITYTDYRSQLSSYLESRMRAIAPNATTLVGFLVAARLVAHAGSLINLAKAPGSTIQILGAEKALFRALKTKHDTPKYGLIYHSSLVGQATGKVKGKIARMLAAKTALGLRYDALNEEPEDETVDEEDRSLLGVSYRLALERRLRVLEGKAPLPKGVNVAPNGELITPGGFSLKEGRKWNAETDGVAEPAVNGKKRKPLIEEVESKELEMKDASEDEEDSDEEPEPKVKKSKKEKKEKKDKKQKEETSIAGSQPPKLTEAQYAKYAEQHGISVSKFKRKYERGDITLNEDGTPRVLSKKEAKKLRKAQEAAAAAPALAESGKKEKKDKKRKHEEEEEQEEAEQPSKSKKHKKKRTSSD